MCSEITKLTWESVFPLILKWCQVILQNENTPYGNTPFIFLTFICMMRYFEPEERFLMQYLAQQINAAHNKIGSSVEGEGAHFCCHDKYYKTLGCFREDLKYRMWKINLPKHSRLQVVISVSNRPQLWASTLDDFTRKENIFCSITLEMLSFLNSVLTRFHQIQQSTKNVHLRSFSIESHNQETCQL